MRNQSNLTESIIIIEPGSHFLKIGRASDSNPKRFAHCIARKLISKSTVRSDPLIYGEHLDLNRETVLDSSMQSTLEKVFAIQPSTCVLPKFLPVESTTGDDAMSKMFDRKDGLDGQRSDVVALDEALELADNSDYLFRWPMRYGIFNDGINQSIVMQDLEEIWATALDNHLSIPRSAIPSHRAILVINDVFRRSEVRHMVDILLTRLRFNRVLVHQAGVCATYAVGLPTACVIELGEEKTCVSCVEDGVSHPDSRVTLAVGRNNVLRVFHSMVFSSQPAWTEFLTEDRCVSKIDFDYCHASDVTALQDLLTTLNKNTLDILRQNASIAQPDQLTENGSENNRNGQASSPRCVSARLRIDREPRLQCDVSLSPETLIVCNLYPFAHIARTALPIVRQSGLFYECQPTQLECSQPDDPFDELYIAMTARERRKRPPGPAAVSTKTDDVAPVGSECASGPVESERAETEVTENVPVAETPLPARPEATKSFESLVDAIWWSIHQCIPGNTTSVSAPPPPATSAGTEPGSNSVSTITTAAGDELRRRLFGCILLVGAGACGLTGHCVQKWLHAELASRVAQLSLTGLTTSQVEVIAQRDQPDSVWIGARLLLTTDLVNDLWVTGAEWNRFGTRALREKAPFFW